MLICLHGIDNYSDCRVSNDFTHLYEKEAYAHPNSSVAALVALVLVFRGLNLEDFRKGILPLRCPPTSIDPMYPLLDLELRRRYPNWWRPHLT